MIGKQQFHSKAHFFLAITIAFFLPLGHWVPVFISLLFLNWLIEGDFKNKFKIIINNKLALLFIGFYLLHLIGLLYTQNMPSGLFDIQVKLSLLIFPLILCSKPIEKEKMKYVFYSLIIGGVVSSFIMLLTAVSTFIKTGQNNFLYEAFAILVHPSYLSMYFNVALVWLFIQIVNNQFKTRLLKFSAIAIILLFSFVNILLSSKLGLISMLFIWLGFIAYYICNRKKYVVGLIGLLLISASYFPIKKYFPEVIWRIQAAEEALTNNKPDNSNSESTAVRMMIWKAANKVVSENIIVGVGTGDVKTELMKEYERRGMTGALEHRLNAHNEYYQVFVALGIVCFLCLLANIFIPLWNSLKVKNYIYMLFLLIIIVNFLTESMLETEAGVMFYTFFNSLLCFTNKKNVQHTTHNL